MQHGTNFFEFLQLGPDGQAQGNIYTIRPYYDIRKKERKKREVNFHLYIIQVMPQQVNQWFRIYLQVRLPPFPISS